MKTRKVTVVVIGDVEWAIVTETSEFKLSEVEPEEADRLREEARHG